MPVAAAARRADRLEALVAEIRGVGGRAVAMACDVTRQEDTVRLVDRTIAEFGSIYAVFANAGYGLERPAAEASDAEWRAIFETNFYGTLNTIRPALPHMLRARSGHVLICSSCVAKMAIPWFGAYSATKAAQDHVARAMGIELRGTGVHVSGVYPIGTTTEFRDASRAASGGYEGPVHTPERFMQKPERVADAIVRCLKRPRPEVWTSPMTRFAFAAGVAFPRLADWGLARMAVEKPSK